MIENKLYRSNEEGKRDFVDEVINPFVRNEGHFGLALYVTNDHGEYIMLYRHADNKTAAYAIDVTCDSISAMAKDFCTRLLDCVKTEDARF